MPYVCVLTPLGFEEAGQPPGRVQPLSVVDNSPFSPTRLTAFLDPVGTASLGGG